MCFINRNFYRSTRLLLIVSGGFLMFSYVACAGVTWLRFGSKSHRRSGRSGDTYLDDLIPNYDIDERFQLAISAPAETVFAATCRLDLLQSPLIQGIFKIREAFLGGTWRRNRSPMGLVALANYWGWTAMIEEHGREIVFGAATRPWVAKPVFRGLKAQEFPGFCEKDYVKIAWTLRVDKLQQDRALVVTETRAIATSRTARRKFRFYWALVAPGTALIRIVALREIKRQVERLNGIS